MIYQQPKIYYRAPSAHSPYLPCTGGAHMAFRCADSPNSARAEEELSEGTGRVEEVLQSPTAEGRAVQLRLCRLRWAPVPISAAGRQPHPRAGGLQQKTAGYAHPVLCPGRGHHTLL